MKHQDSLVTLVSSILHLKATIIIRQWVAVRSKLSSLWVNKPAWKVKAQGTKPDYLSSNLVEEESQIPQIIYTPRHAHKQTNECNTIFIWINFPGPGIITIFFLKTTLNPSFLGDWRKLHQRLATSRGRTQVWNRWKREEQQTLMRKNTTPTCLKHGE